MRCPKCSGLMVDEPFPDFYAIGIPWRCVNCGASPYLITLDTIPSKPPAQKRTRLLRLSAGRARMGFR